MILVPLFPLLFPTTNLAANEVRQLIKELSGAKAKFTSASDSDFEQLKNSVKSDHDKIQKIFSTLIQENDADLMGYYRTFFHTFLIFQRPKTAVSP